MGSDGKVGRVFTIRVPWLQSGVGLEDDSAMIFTMRLSWARAQKARLEGFSPLGDFRRAWLRGGVGLEDDSAMIFTMWLSWAWAQKARLEEFSPFGNLGDDVAWARRVTQRRFSP